MTRSKWFASFAGLLLLSVLAAAFFFSRPATVSEVKSEAAVQAAVETASAISTAFQTAAPMRRVMDLYESESKRVGKVDKNPELTEKRLTAAAKELSAEEIQWLGEQALDGKGEMDARFFAAYLMGLSGSAASIQTLGQVALSPIQPNKNEMKMQEERVLRMQTVEGIAHACKEAGAKEKLLEIIATQTDEGVRDRAHRALYACQTGKKLEDADKAALEKLTSPAP